MQQLPTIQAKNLKELALAVARDRGIARSRDFEAAGVPRIYLQRLRDEGLLTQPGRGLYTLTNSQISAHHSLAEAAKSVPTGVIGLLSALQFHEMTTQLPSHVWMLLPSKAWVPSRPPVTLKILRASGEPTRPHDEYAGVRILFDASIGSARLPIQVDIGFGDAVTPAPHEIEYPSLIGMPAPKLKAYPPETVVAEKLEALVSLGVANSRMKDFYDLWAISRTFAFDGLVLTKAIRATFERRGTTLPTEIPFGLSEAFAANPIKQTQWRAFLRRTEIAMAPEPLNQIIPSIASFLMPVLQSAADERTTPGKWPVSGPWGD